MHVFRKIAAAGIAVAAAGAMLTGVAAAAPAAPPAAPPAVEAPAVEAEDRVRVCVKGKLGSRTTKYVWKKQAPTYCLPDAKKPWGWMSGGYEYFYCQKNWNIRVQDGAYWNTWWALTDDDNHNAGVWMSVVYISEGANGKPVPNLRICS
jgi:hypothetical protein